MIYLDHNASAPLGEAAAEAMVPWLTAGRRGNPSSPHAAGREARGAVERYAIDTRDAPVAAFLSAQRRLATEYCGEIDPNDLDEYQRLSGLPAV